MTVKDLIKRLKTYPQDMQVATLDQDGRYSLGFHVEECIGGDNSYRGNDDTIKDGENFIGIL